MAIYLVDFENVKSQGINGILNLAADDKVFIFFGSKEDRLTFKAHEQIIQSPATFRYLDTSVGGKNALDHQISTCLGYLIGTSGEKQYYIVSHDQGYKHVINFWRNEKGEISIALIDNVKASRSLVINPAVQLAQNGNGAKPPVPREQPATQEPEQAPAAETKANPLGRTPAQAATQSAEKPAAASPAAGAQEPDGKPADAQAARKRAPRSSHNRPPKPDATPVAPEKPAASHPVQAAAQAAPAANGANAPAAAEAAATGQPAPAQNQPAAQNKPVAQNQPASIAAQDRPAPAPVVAAAAENAAPKVQVQEEAVGKLLPDFANEKWIKDVTRYLNTAKSRAALYNSIRSRLGQDVGSRVYNLVKKLY